jgi:Fe-S-cluster-containing dehydrogenase component
MATNRPAFRAELCTACRACEVACSFARLGEYRPSSAGLAVQLDRVSGTVEVTFGNELSECGECNECTDPALPPCVAYCAPGALVVEP